jgi:hypothetical protein
LSPETFCFLNGSSQLPIGDFFNALSLCAPRSPGAAQHL